MIYANVLSFLACAFAGTASATTPNLRALTSNEILSAAEFDALKADMKLEPFIPDKDDIFKKDPLRSFTQFFLDNTGLDILLTTPQDLVFDMFDRVEQKGLRTAAFASLQEFADWQAARSPAFLARYSVLSSPTAAAPLYWMSSPGLPAGQWEEQEIEGVTWRFTATPILLSYYPNCAAATTQNRLVFSEILGSRKLFYSAGTEITELMDPEGNTWLNTGTRGLPNGVIFPPLFPGWSRSTRVLAEDYQTECIYSPLVPENKNGGSSLVCKQLQLTDQYGNVYFLSKLQTGSGETAVLPATEIIVSAPPLVCGAVSFTADRVDSSASDVSSASSSY